ncbi:alpha/beta hydrolase [Micromonospora vulcania]|uniref:Alpha/beta hydrolase n=1 Tax=Micromonospora vulcania TaxID=1441873 RepID=A0ABW1HBV4_9ACTN
MSDTPDTIVLIHGFWVTPRSWEHWVTHYQDKGFRVLTPTYPGLDAEVEALNADPSPLETLTAPQIIEHLTTVLDALPTPPIIMGHSAGGAFTQVLLDRGYGTSAVALNSAPTEGVAITPFSQLRSTFPVLRNPANRHRAVGFTFEQWHYAFTNTFDEDESRALYQRYAIPAAGGILWDSVLANLLPGPQAIAVDYHNDQRAPLLFISGSKDHIMPPSVQQSNARHYQGDTITEVKLYDGYAHLLPAQQGWQTIADDALDWALRHAR